MIKRIIYFYNKVICPNNLEGGAAEVVYKQAKWMAKNTNNEVYLVTSNIAPPLKRKHHAREFFKDGIRFIRLKGYLVGGPLPLDRRVLIPDAPKKIDELTQQGRCIVHFHFHLTPLIGPMIISAKKNKARIIYQPHLHPSYVYPKEEAIFRLSYFRSLFKAEINLSDMVIAITKLEKNKIKRIYKRKKIVIIPNAIDVTEFKNKASRKRIFKKYGLKKKDKFILFVGKLEKRKNPLAVAKVFKNVHKKIPNVKLIYVGKKGDAYKRTKRYLIKNKLINDVIFTGFVSNSERNRFFSLAHVFVLLSRYEAFGISVAQASYNKLPVVVSHVGGLSDIVHKKTGYLVPSKRTIIRASKYVAKLLRDKEKRISMGKEGRRYVIKQFMLDNCLKKLENAYKELIKHR